MLGRITSYIDLCRKFYYCTKLMYDVIPNQALIKKLLLNYFIIVIIIITQCKVSLNVI